MRLLNLKNRRQFTALLLLLVTIGSTKALLTQTSPGATLFLSIGIIISGNSFAFQNTPAIAIVPRPTHVPTTHRSRSVLTPCRYTSQVASDDDETKPSSAPPPRQRRRFRQWLALQSGKNPRGTNRVILREAEELGGVPRSDRYSSRDWFHNTITLPNSAILRDIKSPVLAVTSWATFLSLVHEYWLQQSLQKASRLYFPLAPHSLMMSALGLLLVFRTNSAYQRFAEGRKIWEQIVNAARDLYRMTMLYEKEIGTDKRQRLQQLLAAFPYLLRHRIRPGAIAVMRRLDDEEHQRDPENTILLYQDAGPTDNDPEAGYVARAEEETGKSRRKTRPLFWVDKRSLPWKLLPDNALEQCTRAQNRPLWVCDRMAKEIREVPDGPNFSARERLALIGHVNKLSASVGGAERIHQTVVPLNYARHTLRALTLWLFSFPLAVVKDLHLMTGPTLFLVSWLLFGVYEIGYAIEDPFQGSLRLSILCDTIRRDVMGSKLRTSAFELDDDLAETEEEDDDEREGEDDTYHPGLKNPMVNSRPNAVGNKPPISLPRFLKQAQSPDAYQ